MSVEETEDTVFCTDCRTVLPADADYCSECGTEQVGHEQASGPEHLPVGKRYCSDCGTVLDEVDAYCRECGTEQPTTEAGAAAEHSPPEGAASSTERSGFHEAMSYMGSGMLFLLALIAFVPTSDYPAPFVGSGLLFTLGGVLTLPTVKRYVSRNTDVTVTRAASIVLSVLFGFAGLMLFGSAA